MLLQVMVRLCFVGVDAMLDLGFQSLVLIFDFDFRFSIFKYFFVLTLSRVSATVISVYEVLAALRFHKRVGRTPTGYLGSWRVF